MKSSASAGSSRRRRHWPTRVLLLGLLLSLSIFFVGRQMAPVLAPPGATPVAATKPTEGAHGNWHYFRTGLWLADLRTFVAACRYVLEPEPGELG